MASKISNSLTVRAAALEDVDAVVDLINTVAVKETGVAATGREDQLIEWGLPQFNLETDTWLVLAGNGNSAGGQPLVGFVQLWDSEPHVRHYLFGRVHPDYQRQGIGSYLMDWAETRARQSLDKAPPEARVAIHTTAAHHNQATHDLFRVRGYTPTRCFYRMMIEMEPDAPPPEPVWPAGIGVRSYRLGPDDRAVHRTLDETMQDHWGYVNGETFEEWFHWIEEDEKFDPSVCFLAVTGDDEIVGVLMARPEWEGDASFAWIDELGVLRPWRRQGIALALLRQSFGEFHRQGRYKVGLAVDADSLTGALGLYEKAGMHVFQQRDAYEKVLRPGVDLSTQAVEG
jgi:mycothiol synthase